MSIQNMPAPIAPAVPTSPDSAIEEERATLGIADSFFPQAKPSPQRWGVGPEFGSFRPVLGRPDSVEGEQALLEVMRAFDRDRPVPSKEIIVHSAELLSGVSFPKGGEGYALTVKLVQAILCRQLEAFGNEHRLQFGAAVGRREFPDDDRLAKIQARWVCGAIEPLEEEELERALSRRGVGIHELVPGSVWVRGEPLHRSFGDNGSIDLARIIESRGLSSGPVLPPGDAAS